MTQFNVPFALPDNTSNSKPPFNSTVGKSQIFHRRVFDTTEDALIVDTVVVDGNMADDVAEAIESPAERIVRCSYGRIGLARIVEVRSQPEMKALAVEALVYELGKGVHIVSVLDEVGRLFGAIALEIEFRVVDMEYDIDPIAEIAYSDHGDVVAAWIDDASRGQFQPIVNAFRKRDRRAVLAVGDGNRRRQNLAGIILCRYGNRDPVGVGDVALSAIGRMNLKMLGRRGVGSSTISPTRNSFP